MSVLYHKHNPSHLMLLSVLIDADDHCLNLNISACRATETVDNAYGALMSSGERYSLGRVDGNSTI